MQISQESTCVGVFFNEIAGPQNCNFIKKRLQDNSFEFCELFKNTYFVKDLWTAGSETLVCLFNSFFYGTSPVAASESFRFQLVTLLKKKLQHNSCEFCELFKNTYFVQDLWAAGFETLVRLFKNSFFTEHLLWLLQKVSGFQSATLLKSRLRQRCLSVSIAKFLRTYLDRTPPKDCFLCLSMNFERFFRSPFL